MAESTNASMSARLNSKYLHQCATCLETYLTIQNESVGHMIKEWLSESKVHSLSRCVVELHIVKDWVSETTLHSLSRCVSEPAGHSLMDAPIAWLIDTMIVWFTHWCTDPLIIRPQDPLRDSFVDDPRVDAPYRYMYLLASYSQLTPDLHIHYAHNISTHESWTNTCHLRSYCKHHEQTSQR